MLRLRYILFWSAAWIEGVAAFVLLFAIRSEEGNQFLFGYSMVRIALGTVVLALALVCMIAAGRAFFDTAWVMRVHTRLEKWQAGDGLLCLMTVLAGVFVFLGLLVLLAYSPYNQHLEMLGAVIQRGVSLIVWLELLLLQAIGLLWFNFHRPNFFRLQPFGKLVLVLFILGATAFQWLIFIGQDSFFTAIDGWYWQYRPKPFSITFLWFIPLLAAAMAVIWWVFKTLRASSEKMKWGVLLLIFALGVALQVGFGWMAGQGIESLRQKFLISGHYRIVEYTCDGTPDALDTLRTYDETLRTVTMLGTKPPGMLLFYVGIQWLTNIVDPVDTFSGICTRITQFSAYVFPVFTYLVLFVIFALAARYMQGAAVLPALLYVFSPNVILIVLHLDQFLYPLIFTLGTYLAVLASEKRPFWLGVLFGGMAYVGIFISFSLLALIPMGGLCVLLTAWAARRTDWWKTTLRAWGGMLVGFAVLYGVFVLIGYDAWTRYQHAMELHRAVKLYEQILPNPLERLGNMLLINNVEFAFWTGIPVFVLAFVGVGRSVGHVLKKKGLRPLDALALAFLLVYLALNVLGQTRSEVGRLWLFLLPVMMLFAANELRQLSSRPQIAFYATAAVQLITTLLTFWVQDFY